MEIKDDLWSRVQLRSSGKVKRSGSGMAYLMIKQMFDLLVSFFLLILALPLFLTISILLYKKEGFPILSREKKVGKGGRLFTLYTFRTLTKHSKIIRAFPPHPFPNDWKHGVPNEFVYKKSDNRIVTRTGSWLIKCKLDQLPKLLNVISGQMSFVGPEPENEDIAAYYNEEQTKRLEMKPGMISYKNKEMGVAQGYESKVKADLYYIRNSSYILDTKTVLRVIKSRRHSI